MLSTHFHLNINLTITIHDIQFKTVIQQFLTACEQYFITSFCYYSLYYTSKIPCNCLLNYSVTLISCYNTNISPCSVCTPYIIIHRLFNMHIITKKSVIQLYTYTISVKFKSSNLIYSHLCIGFQAAMTNFSDVNMNKINCIVR